jgi:hypothetical protein
MSCPFRNRRLRKPFDRITGLTDFHHEVFFIGLYPVILSKSFNPCSDPNRRHYNKISAKGTGIPVYKTMHSGL